MRVELLEPGGYSAWPTSPWATATMRAPGPEAFCSAAGNDAGAAVAPVVGAKAAVGAATGVAAGAATGCGFRSDCSWVTRAMASSRLIALGHRPRGRRLNRKGRAA